MILMSNNQWKNDINRPAWAERGEDCSAEGRVDGLVRAYTSVMPDLLGLQEVSVRMADLMMARMERVGCADGSTARYEYVSGGDTPVVYRRDKLRLLESGFYLYPEEIPGIGPAKRKILTETFGSVNRIRALSAEELAAAPGISARDAEEIVRFFAAAQEEKEQ